MPQWKNFQNHNVYHQCTERKKLGFAQEKETKTYLLKNIPAVRYGLKSFFITFHFCFTISQKMFGSYLQEF